MDERGTLTNGPKGKKIDDYGLGFTFKRWLTQSAGAVEYADGTSDEG